MLHRNRLAKNGRLGLFRLEKLKNVPGNSMPPRASIECDYMVKARLGGAAQLPIVSKSPVGSCSMKRAICRQSFWIVASETSSWPYF